MTPATWIPVEAAVLAVLVLIAAAVVLSAAEAALAAANRARLHVLEKSGEPRAERLSAIVAEREGPAAALRLARMLATVLATGLVADLTVSFGTGLGAAATAAALTLLAIVLVEVGPRMLVAEDPEAAGLALLPVIAIGAGLLRPVLVVVEGAVRLPLSLIRRRTAEEERTAHEEIRDAVDLLHREGEVVKSDRDMVGGVLDLSQLSLADIMVHRTKMRAIDADAPPAEIVAEVLASPFTRLPVWRDEPENIVGVLHAKDLHRAIDRLGGDLARLDVMQVATPPWFVPETTTADAQLRAFLKRKIHMALVVDEYGVVQGVVTLEDVLEEIVGDISDEQDVVVQGVRPLPDGSVNVDGGVPIRDLNRMMDWRLPDDEATTVAGLVIHEARLIPEPGQSFTFHGFRFRVLRRQRNRITALKVTPVEKLAG
jgi:Mg2+/Co2+ transporter CorB